MMNRLVIFCILLACFFIFVRICWIWHLKKLRQGGLYPRKGKGTLFDVRRLLVNGEKEAALRLYSEIFTVDSQQAKKAVEELEKSLKN